MFVCGGRGGWGVDGGWTHLPTRQQRYCDAASLVGQRIADAPTIVFTQSLLTFTDGGGILQNRPFRGEEMNEDLPTVRRQHVG